jgi:16S rRNA (uracil1498-N3)-methyltransferase
MSNRFFLDYAVSRLEAGEATLAGNEAHHFSKVMRGKVGDKIVLFDGTGHSYSGMVEAVRKNEVKVRLMETFCDTIESPLRLTVAAALPKGDRQHFLIEKLAELGVARFVPVLLERSVARSHSGMIDRFRRYVIEAAKQCGRNVLMEIADEVPIQNLNDIFVTGDIAKFLLHPASLGEAGQTTPKHILAERLPPQVAVLVGPEGSFTDQEVESALRFGFQPLDLGKRILRTETACIAAASLFLTYAG